MNKFKYQTIESVGSVLWLLTDFLWMNGFLLSAAALTIPVFLLLVGACIRYDGGKKSELLALTASALWFIMNMTWIYSDIGHKEEYLLCSRITFLIAALFVYMAFRASKKEKEPTDFKRLKIK